MTFPLLLTAARAQRPRRLSLGRDQTDIPTEISKETTSFLATGKIVAMRRWISVAGGIPTSCVAPNTHVRADILAVGGDSAPDFIEVRRTYETAIGRLMHAFLGSSSKKVIELAKTADDGNVAEYETWPAVQYEPFVKPTRLYYRDLAGKRGDRTPPLSVTPTVDIATNRPAAVLKAADPTGTVPLGVEIPLWPEKNMKVTVQAPVDPEIELFAITPTEGAEILSLGGYVDSYLSSVEDELGEDPGFSEDPAQLRSIFEREYEAFVLGAGRISAEIESPRRVVEPGKPQEFEVTLHPESAGEMMMVIGARDAESGEVLSVSELLPLHWKAGDEPVSVRDLVVEDDFEVIRDVERVSVSARSAPAPAELEADA